MSKLWPAAQRQAVAPVLVAVATRASPSRGQQRRAKGVAGISDSPAVAGQRMLVARGGEAKPVNCDTGAPDFIRATPTPSFPRKRESRDGGTDLPIPAFAEMTCRAARGPAGAQPTRRTLMAQGPFSLRPISYSTVSPTLRSLKSVLTSSRWKKKRLGPPAVGVMKP